MPAPLYDIPLPKLREMRDAFIWMIERRTISDGFYFTSGRYNHDEYQRMQIEKEISRRLESEKP